MTRLDQIIPEGGYCYSYDLNGNKVICPFWFIFIDKPKQDNGYCSYLNRGDWENPHVLNLLWDRCKECDVNWSMDEDEDDMETTVARAEYFEER
jgi:hypothetical protein